MSVSVSTQFNTSSSPEDGETGSDVKQDIKDVIARYKKEPKKCPYLGNLAKKYLCVVATSTVAERILSSLA